MTLSNRLISMFLDYILMTLVVAIIGVPLQLITSFFQQFLDYGQDTLIVILLAVIFLNKDFFRGKSPAKRLMGLQVVNAETGEPASRAKCFVRNLTILIWPVEVIATLVSMERRVGDVIANTRVQVAEKEPLDGFIQEIKDAAKRKD